MGATEQTKIVCNYFVTPYFSLFHSFLPLSYILQAVSEKLVTKFVTECSSPNLPTLTTLKSKSPKKKAKENIESLDDLFD
jgi:hypothetical protein